MWDLTWPNLIITWFGICASILAFAQYFMIKTDLRKKIFIFFLIAIIAAFAVDRVRLIINERLEQERQVLMKQDAKSVSDSIIITGWESPGDYIGYLTQLTSFYERHKEYYKKEAEIYGAELSNYRAVQIDRRKEGKELTIDDRNNLRGLVSSGKEQTQSIAAK